MRALSAPWKAQLAAMAMLTRLPKGRESLLVLEAQDIEPGSGLSNRIGHALG